MNTLYRAWSNNGVHTVLTQEAVNADFQRQKLARQNGNYDGTEALQKVVARGTFTFVDQSVYEYFRGYVTGTLQELDRWVGASCYLSYDYQSSNYVPFSNGDLDSESKDYVRTPSEVIEAFGLLSAVSISERV